MNNLNSVLFEGVVKAISDTDGITMGGITMDVVSQRWERQGRNIINKLVTFPVRIEGKKLLESMRIQKLCVGKAVRVVGRLENCFILAEHVEIRHGMWKIPEETSIKDTDCKDGEDTSADWEEPDGLGRTDGW